MKPLKIIAFDYDGVIVDSFDHNIEIVNKTLTQLGHQRLATADDLCNLKKMTFTQLGLDLGVDPKLVNELELKTAQELINATGRVDCFPGMVDFFVNISKYHKLAIISNTTSEAIITLLTEKGIIDCFATIYGGDHPGSKAEKLEDLSFKLKTHTSEICMVGDALSDIQAGKDAGTRTMAVTWGFQSEELLATLQPDHIVRSIKDMNTTLTK